MILVIDRRNSLLRYENGTLRLERPGEPPRRAPINQLDLVVVYGSPLAETAVWRHLAGAGIPTVMLPSRGAEGAAVLGNGLATQFPLRRLQHRCAARPTQALALARWVVARKLAGYDLPLAALGRRHGAGARACRDFRERRDQALEDLDTAMDGDALRGIEGAVAHAWFGLLAATLAPAWKFQGRNRRPPRDPVNALLSLGYTLIAAEIHRGVLVSGLDPSLGFLHPPASGRESLVLDLTEIFRTGVDQFVLEVIDPGGPRQGDFYYRETQGCRLSKAARPLFYQAWATQREAWPHPLADVEQEEWPTAPLREQINGWIERLRAFMKQLAGEEA